jgi:hypothetical protein
MRKVKTAKEKVEIFFLTYALVIFFASYERSGVLANFVPKSFGAKATINYHYLMVTFKNTKEIVYLMSLAEILSKGNIQKGSKVAMMPAFYGHEDIGYALRELEATGIFVDHDEEILDTIRTLFPEFDARKGDALTFQEHGVITTVHYRPMPNYPHETIRPCPNAEIYGPGFDKMVHNIYTLSPNFVLFSVSTNLFGNVDVRAEEIEALKNAGFKVVEEGTYRDRQVERYIVSRR